MPDWLDEFDDMRLERDREPRPKDEVQGALDAELAKPRSQWDLGLASELLDERDAATRGDTGFRW